MTETTCAKCGESIDAAKITLLREQAEVAEQMEQDELAHLRARLAEVEAERNAYKGRIADADVSIGNLQAAWKKMKAERNAAIQRTAELEANLAETQRCFQQEIAESERLEKCWRNAETIREQATKRAERAEQALGGVVIADHTNAADCTNTIVAQDAAGTVTYAAMQAQLAAALARADKLAAGVERVREWLRTDGSKIAREAMVYLDSLPEQ